MNLKAFWNTLSFIQQPCLCMRSCFLFTLNKWRWNEAETTERETTMIADITNHWMCCAKHFSFRSSAVCLGFIRKFIDCGILFGETNDFLVHILYLALSEFLCLMVAKNCWMKRESTIKKKFGSVEHQQGKTQHVSSMRIFCAIPSSLTSTTIVQSHQASITVGSMLFGLELSFLQSFWILIARKEIKKSFLLEKFSKVGRKFPPETLQSTWKLAEKFETAGQTSRKLDLNFDSTLCKWVHNNLAPKIAVVCNFSCRTSKGNKIHFE